MKAYLGVDVSKGYADFVLLDSNKINWRRYFNWMTRQGHVCLEKQLECLIGEHKISHLYCAVESTGGFENNWYTSFLPVEQEFSYIDRPLKPCWGKKSCRGCIKP